MPRAVALLSGGLDSGVAVALWRAAGEEIALCLTADYGQRSAAAERQTAQRFADHLDLPWRLLRLPALAEVARRSKTALVAADAELPQGTPEHPGDAASAAAVWVPARNVVLITHAAAWAEVVDADVVLTGFNREEAATFADNSADFVGAMSSALRLGTRHGARVESPTLAMTKPEIAAAARRLALMPDQFWSCYGPGPEPCGRCESCARSERAWRAADAIGGC